MTQFAVPAEVLCPGFADLMLYLGGDVGEDTFHCLHPYDLRNAREVRLWIATTPKRGRVVNQLDCSGPPLHASHCAWSWCTGTCRLAHELMNVPVPEEFLHPDHQVMRGVHLGGFEAAKAGLESGELDEANFKCLTRYSGWCGIPPCQLYTPSPSMKLIRDRADLAEAGVFHGYQCHCACAMALWKVARAGSGSSSGQTGSSRDMRSVGRQGARPAGEGVPRGRVAHRGSGRQLRPSARPGRRRHVAQGACWLP